MANSTVPATGSTRNWQSSQVYLLSAFCLLVGLLVGYLLRGSQSTGVTANPVAGNIAKATSSMRGAPTLDQMKHMAEKKAEPLLAKLQSDPQNAVLLVQIADVYKQTHQFAEAADYYSRAVKADPKNTGVRSDLASCLYYTGDTDGALAQLEEAIKQDPTSAPALFNLGMVRWQGKQDAAGAVEAWQQLLKTNPKLSADRKSAVEKLIADAGQHLKK